MAIYPDKKDGKLNGRFRVELQRGKERYRKRWDTFAEAQKDEQAVLAAWGAGEALPAPGEAPGSPQVHTLASVIEAARGMLWEGKASEVRTWQRMEIIADLLGPKTRLDAIDTHTVDGLIKKLKTAGRADATINRYLSHLKTFLTWASKRKYRTIPVTEIEFAWKKESAGRIRWITLDEERRIGEYLLSRTHERAEAAQAIWKLIQVAIATGCRRNELRTVEPSQINGNLLHLWETKTDTPRTVPMEPHITALLVDLVTSGTMPTERGLRSWWGRIKSHLGLDADDDFVFHACRHTCATRMVDADVNVFVIKEWMGHKVMETTLRYAHVKPQNLTDALSKVGNHVRLVADKSQKSAILDVPHTLPTGGVMEEIAEAA